MARERRVVKVGELGETNKWYTLPASSTSLSQEKGVVNDSVFDSFFNSNQTTVKSWTTSINGFTNKGVAGYHATIKRVGGEVNVEGVVLSYKDAWVDEERRVWKVGSVTVYNDGVDVTNSVTIDHLQGRVFSSSPLSNVTADFTFYTMMRVCDASSLSLSLSLGVQNVSTFCELADDNGWATFSPEMKSVEMSLEGWEFSEHSWVWDGFTSGEEVIIEVDINGRGDGARGYFTVVSKNLSGDLGSRDVKRSSFVLSNKKGLEYPFSWYAHTMPKAVQVAIEGWMHRKLVGVAYKGADSTLWHGGRAYVEDMQFDVDVQGVATVSMSFQGDGIKDKQDETFPTSLLLDFVKQNYRISTPIITDAIS